MGVVELSKALYGPYVTGENLRKVMELDEADQAYFWTKLYYTLEHNLTRSWLKDIEDAVASRVEAQAELSATPFKDAESSIRAGSWFRRTHVH